LESFPNLVGARNTPIKAHGSCAFIAAHTVLFSQARMTVTDFFENDNDLKKRSGYSRNFWASVLLKLSEGRISYENCSSSSDKLAPSQTDARN
jgi:hypothetical protein